MSKNELKHLFDRVVEVKADEARKVGTLLKKFPIILQNTLQEISDPLEREAAELISLQQSDDGNFRVILCEGAAERRRAVALYRNFVEREWQARNFAEVVKLCQVALVLDPDDLEILCFLGRAKWELDDLTGCDLVREAARRDRKFQLFSDKIEEEKKSRDKLTRRMASGIFSDENMKRARLEEWKSRRESVCGRLAGFFMISGVGLFFLAVTLAVLIE